MGKILSLLAGNACPTFHDLSPIFSQGQNKQMVLKTGSWGNENLHLAASRPSHIHATLHGLGIGPPPSRPSRPVEFGGPVTLASAPHRPPFTVWVSVPPPLPSRPSRPAEFGPRNSGVSAAPPTRTRALSGYTPLSVPTMDPGGTHRHYLPSPRHFLYAVTRARACVPVIFPLREYRP